MTSSIFTRRHKSRIRGDFGSYLESEIRSKLNVSRPALLNPCQEDTSSIISWRSCSIESMRYATSISIVFSLLAEPANRRCKLPILRSSQQQLDAAIVLRQGLFSYDPMQKTMSSLAERSAIKLVLILGRCFLWESLKYALWNQVIRSQGELWALAKLIAFWDSQIHCIISDDRGEEAFKVFLFANDVIVLKTWASTAWNNHGSTGGQSIDWIAWIHVQE